MHHILQGSCYASSRRLYCILSLWPDFKNKKQTFANRNSTLPFSQSTCTMQCAAEAHSLTTIIPDLYKWATRCFKLVFCMFAWNNNFFLTPTSKLHSPNIKKCPFPDVKLTPFNSSINSTTALKFFYKDFPDTCSTCKTGQRWSDTGALTYDACLHLKFAKHLK